MKEIRTFKNKRADKVHTPQWVFQNGQWIDLSWDRSISSIQSSRLGQDGAYQYFAKIFRSKAIVQPAKSFFKNPRAHL